MIQVDNKEEFDMKEIYRALAITAAHLHLIIRETLFVSAAAEPLHIHQCAMDTNFELKNIRAQVPQFKFILKSNFNRRFFIAV